MDQLGGHYTKVRRWLLTPVAGLAAFALLATVVNKLGFPAKTFGWPLLGVLLAANVIYWLWRRPRPRIEWRKVGLWSGAFFVAALLVGWPLIVAGTDWISVGNGDMSVYVLSANHFYEHGFYQLPPVKELLSEVEPSWDASFYYSYGEVRSTSQLLLACFMAVSGLTAAQAYMILNVALHLVVLASAAALVCTAKRRERVALATLLVVGSSANVALGLFLQLIPQDLGLAALLACATVLLDRPVTGVTLYRQGILGGLLLALLLAGYPEMAPFLVLGILTFAVIALLKGEVRPIRWLQLFGITAASTLVCGNLAVPPAVHFMIWSSWYSNHSAAATNVLFPNYLTPIGLGQFWGLLSNSSDDMTSWYAQASVGAGAVLLVFAVVQAARAAWRLEPTGVMAGVMLLLFIPLFSLHNGFGLFKLAMYAQPFVLGALTIVAWDWVRGRSISIDAGAPS